MATEVFEMKRQQGMRVSFSIRCCNVATAFFVFRLIPRRVVCEIRTQAQTAASNAELLELWQAGVDDVKAFAAQWARN